MDHRDFGSYCALKLSNSYSLVVLPDKQDDIPAFRTSDHQGDFDHSSTHDPKDPLSGMATITIWSSGRPRSRGLLKLAIHQQAHPTIRTYDIV
jgi:hypothetical protein